MYEQPLTRQEIEEALRVCEAATSAPWEVGVQGEERSVLWADAWGVLAEFDSGEPDEANLKFTALARTLLPKALRELLAAREEADRVKGELGATAAAIVVDDHTEAYHHIYLALVGDLMLPAEEQRAIMTTAIETARAKEAPCPKK